MHPPEKILVVDDNPMNRDILVKLLPEHYEVETANDGDSCLEMVHQFQPQLVLLDVMMPGADGYEVCQQIKSEFDGEFVQVVLVSGKGSAEERLRGYEAQADDYIVKPFNHAELLSKIRVHFRLWQAHRELCEARDQLATYSNELERLVTLRTQQLTSTQDMAVFALAQLADSRDPDTGEHIRRMRAYSQVLAEELSVNGPYTDVVDDKFLEDLFRSSPLHDIGKVGIPDSILLKPARLTDEEFDAMKQHVTIGAETLETAARHGGQEDSFLHMAAEIARFHHERFDGSGYCAGVVGYDIPLSARIVALADVYDALTSRRVYKAAYEPEAALETIERDAGTHFDPAVVDAFIDRFEDFKKIGRMIDEGDPNSLTHLLTEGRFVIGREESAAETSLTGESLLPVLGS